jgi:hypothetical protein
MYSTRPRTWVVWKKTTHFYTECLLFIRYECSERVKYHPDPSYCFFGLPPYSRWACSLQAINHSYDFFFSWYETGNDRTDKKVVFRKFSCRKNLGYSSKLRWIDHLGYSVSRKLPKNQYSVVSKVVCEYHLKCSDYWLLATIFPSLVQQLFIIQSAWFFFSMEPKIHTYLKI